MLKINIKKLPKSELEIEGEVEIDAFEAYFSKALKKIGEKLELPGFRKGKVPENVLLSNIPEAQILGEMAEMALKKENHVFRSDFNKKKHQKIQKPAR